MARYDITHTCGCTITHQIYGKVSERAGREEWLAEQPCKECRYKAQNEAAAEANRDMPELTGSVKQIAWAETLRAKAAKSLNSMRETIVARRDRGPAEADKLLAIIDETLAQTESRYWIDTRNSSFDVRWLAAQEEA